ncbi:hypothetical protein D3C72_1958240 [compost metagenome]
MCRETLSAVRPIPHSCSKRHQKPCAFKTKKELEALGELSVQSIRQIFLYEVFFLRSPVINAERSDSLFEFRDNSSKEHPAFADLPRIPPSSRDQTFLSTGNRLKFADVLPDVCIQTLQKRWLQQKAVG